MHHLLARATCVQVKFYEVPEDELENLRNDFK